MFRGKEAMMIIVINMMAFYSHNGLDGLALNGLQGLDGLDGHNGHLEKSVNFIKFYY